MINNTDYFRVWRTAFGQVLGLRQRRNTIYFEIPKSRHNYDIYLKKKNPVMNDIYIIC